MAEMQDGYPFIFQMIDKSGTDELLIETLQYRFKSTKSHHTYIVRVEKYVSHSYCLKFFDKANINSKNKFSLRTNTFEPRTIFYTLYHIMLDVLHKDEKPLSSLLAQKTKRMNLDWLQDVSEFTDASFLQLSVTVYLSIIVAMTCHYMFW